MSGELEELFGVELPDSGSETPGSQNDPVEETIHGEGEDPPQETGGTPQTEEPGAEGASAGEGDGESGGIGSADGEMEAQGLPPAAQPRQTAQEQVDALLSGAGLIDPYTQLPIRSMEDLKAYRERYDRERRREFQESHNMTDEDYAQFVQELPEVRAAREAQERAQAQQVQEQIAADLREIGKYDPTVKQLSDLAGREEYGELCRMVERGYSLSDAWKLRHMEDISRQGAQAARQSALNSVSSKEHLQETGQRGKGSAPVPAEVAEEYRAFMPGISDEEISRHYNNYAKEKE